MIGQAVIFTCECREIKGEKTSWRTGTTPLEKRPKVRHTTSMENKANNMKNQFQSLIEDRAFVDAIAQLPAFVDDTNADSDMAYDWVCEMADCSSFVCDNKAWDMFYNAWESCENRNELNTFQIA